jgi:ubiquinone/menaquinone biosynthesis C-methylase UbiE
MKKSMIWDPQLFKDHYERSTNNNIIRFFSEKRKYEFYMDSLALKNSDIILDAGCGYGRFSKLICNKVSKVIGVDINPENVSYASNYVGPKFEGHVVDLSLGKLPFDDNSIDKILFDNVLVFFNKEAQKKLFIEIKSVLKNGGVIAFNIENENYFLLSLSNLFTFLYKSKAKLQGKTTPTHHKYSISFYEKYLSELGFTNIKSIGDSFYKQMGLGPIEIFPAFVYPSILNLDRKHYNTAKKNSMYSFTVAATLSKY